MSDIAVLVTPHGTRIERHTDAAAVFLYYINVDDDIVIAIPRDLAAHLLANFRSMYA